MPPALPTPAQILRTAADYLERHGYHHPTHPRDNYQPWSRSSRPAASDVRAITWAIYGRCFALPEPEPTHQFRLYRQAINAYVDHLERIDDTGLCDPDTALDVIHHMRTAAEEWEATR